MSEAEDRARAALAARSRGLAAPLPARPRRTSGIRYVPQPQRQVLARAGDPPKKRSILGQITNAVQNVPAGLVQFATGTGGVMLAPFRMGIDMVQGDTRSRLDDVDLSTVTRDNIAQVLGPNVATAGQTYAPFAHEGGLSFQRTAGNIRHPSRYVDAYNEGRIVDTILEDAGNVALLAGGAGAVAKVGSASRLPGAARVAKVADTSARGLNLVADSPIRVPVGAARLGGRQVVKALEKSPAMTERFSTHLLHPKVKNTGPEFRRAARRGAVEGRRKANWTQDKLMRRAQETGDIVPEQGAAGALANSVAHVDHLATQRAAQMGLDINDPAVQQAIQQTTARRDLPEQTFTPDIAAITRPYLEGSLPAEQVARVDANEGVYRQMVDEVTQEPLDGEGRLTGGLDPEQLGDDPIDRYMRDAVELIPDEDTRKMIFKMRDGDPALDLEGMDWEDIGLDVPEVAEILLSPSVYPARWRPALMSAARFQAAGIDMPLTPRDMLAAGVPSPIYIPGGRSRILNPKSIGTQHVPVAAGTPGVRSMSSEHFRQQAETQAYSFRVLAEKLSDEVRTTEMNKAILDWVEQTGATYRVESVIKPTILAQMRQRAEAQAKLTRGTDAEIAQTAREIYGQDVIDALDEAGYEILPGDIDAPRSGDFDPSAAVIPAMVTDNNIILPKGVKARLMQRWEPKVANLFLGALETTNAIWKRNVLPFSVRWHLGDMVGGAFMSWVGGGIPPTELFNAMRRLDDLGPDFRRQLDEHVLNNPDLVQSGVEMQQIQWMQRNTPNQRVPKTRVGKGIEKVRQKSYGINNAINSFNRHRYVVAKTQRVLDDMGLSLDDLGGDPARWADPKVQDAINEAVADANRVMGDFDNMTPFEQRWMRGVFPFYLWQRHITQLAWRTAVNNPRRLVWTLRLGAYGAEQQEELPEWLAGSIGVGPWLIPTSYMNPLYDVTGRSMLSDPLRSVAPLIKVGAAAGVGVNLSDGTSPISRPFGTGPSDGSPLPLLNPLRNVNLPEMAYFTASMFPAARAAIQMSPTMEVAGVGLGPHPRYQQGTMMVDRNGNPIDTNRRAVEGLRAMGVPLPTSRADAQAIMAAQAEREAIAANKARKVRIGLP